MDEETKKLISGKIQGYSDALSKANNSIQYHTAMKFKLEGALEILNNLLKEGEMVLTRGNLPDNLHKKNRKKGKAKK